jgi:hypothetical protein
MLEGVGSVPIADYYTLPEKTHPTPLKSNPPATPEATPNKAVYTAASHGNWAQVETLVETQIASLESQHSKNVTRLTVQYLADGPANTSYQKAILAAAGDAPYATPLLNVYRQKGALAFTQDFKNLATKLAGTDPDAVADLLNDPLLQPALRGTIKGAMTPGQDVSTSTRTVVVPANPVTFHMTGELTTAHLTTTTSYAGTVIQNLAAITQIAFDAGGPSATSAIGGDFLAVVPANRYVGGKGSLFYGSVGDGSAESGLTTAVADGNSALALSIMGSAAKTDRPDFVQFTVNAETKGLATLSSAGSTALTNYRQAAYFDHVGSWEGWGDGLTSAQAAAINREIDDLPANKGNVQAEATAATTLDQVFGATSNDYTALKSFAPFLAGVPGAGLLYAGNFTAQKAIASITSSPLGPVATAGATPPAGQTLSDYRWALRAVIGLVHQAGIALPLAAKGGSFDSVLTLAASGVNAWRFKWLEPQSGFGNWEYAIPLGLGVAAGVRKAAAQLLLKNGVTEWLGISPSGGLYPLIQKNSAKVLGNTTVLKALGEDPSVTHTLEALFGKYGWSKVGWVTDAAWLVGDAANTISYAGQAAGSDGQLRTDDIGNAAAFALSAGSDLVLMAQGVPKAWSLLSGSGAGSTATALSGEGAPVAEQTAEQVLGAILPDAAADGAAAIIPEVLAAAGEGAAEGVEGGPWTAIAVAGAQVIAAGAHTFFNDLTIADQNNAASTEYLELLGVNSNIAPTLAAHKFAPLSASNGDSAGPAISSYLNGYHHLTGKDLATALNMIPTAYLASEFTGAATSVASVGGHYVVGTSTPSPAEVTLMELSNEGAIAVGAGALKGDWSPTTLKGLDVWVEQNLPKLATYLHLPQY